jgi:CspA family cold shock protein
MSQGKIKVLKNGFGFITPDDGGKDLFFHMTGLVGVDFNTLQVGQMVTYDVAQSDKGPKAENVKLA